MCNLTAAKFVKIVLSKQWGSIINFWYNNLPRSIVGWSFVCTGPQSNKSVALTSCGFETFNLVSVIGTFNGTKWPRKLSFQIVLILEQQVLFHFKFLEAQKNKISHREYIFILYVHTCQFSATHPSFKDPHPQAILLTFYPTCGNNKWMTVKPKIFLYIGVKW